MVELNSVSSSVAGLSGSGAAANKTQSLGQDDFLKLMISQLKNQDPFKPMENGEFLGQMAQFSTVAGIQEMKDSFAEFGASMTANQLLSASNLIGRDAMLDLNQVPGRERPWEGQVELPRAGNLSVYVKDASGAIVHSIELGRHSAGPVSFSTPVLPAPASYTIEAQLGDNQSGQQLPVQMAGRILGIELGADDAAGVAVEVETLGSIPLDAIRRVQQETI